MPVSGVHRHAYILYRKQLNECKNNIEGNWEIYYVFKQNKQKGGQKEKTQNQLNQYKFLRNIDIARAFRKMDP